MKHFLMALQAGTAYINGNCGLNLQHTPSLQFISQQQQRNRKTQQQKSNMSKLALIVLFAVLVGCVTANRPPRPVCRSHKGELVMGPGRACELICPRSKLHKPLEKCMKLARPQCLCCRNSGYCRNTKTGKCNKLRRRN